MNYDAVKSPFSEVAHIGVVVKDLEKAVKRLESLGIGPFEPLSLPPFSGKLMFRGKPLDPEVKEMIANLGSVSLVLFEPGKGESPWREFLDSKGEGVHHVAFTVDDLDKETSELTKRGMKSLGGTKWQGGGGGFYFDPEIGGVLFELFKP